MAGVARDSGAELKKEQEATGLSVASPATLALADRLTTNGAFYMLLPPVLGSFRIEQDGKTIRFVDGDGSVYVGRMQIEVAEAASVGAAAAAAQPLTARALRSGDGASDRARAAKASAETSFVYTYSFRVEGTSRTLAKPIVFSGTLVTSNPQAATNLFNGQIGGTTTPGSLALTNVIARVNGKAIIGGSKEVEINAQAMDLKRR
jgi:hypothetical protein